MSQTGNENSIDKLLKQISSFMAEISDEFKIVVIDAIRCRLLVAVLIFSVLCLKFPKKQGALMSFLSSALRDEVRLGFVARFFTCFMLFAGLICQGGREYKAAIVETIISLVENIPEAKETGAASVCVYPSSC